MSMWDLAGPHLHIRACTRICQVLMSMWDLAGQPQYMYIYM